MSFRAIMIDSYYHLNKLLFCTVYLHPTAPAGAASASSDCVRRKWLAAVHSLTLAQVHEIRRSHSGTRRPRTAESRNNSQLCVLSVRNRLHSLCWTIHSGGCCEPRQRKHKSAVLAKSTCPLHLVKRTLHTWIVQDLSHHSHTPDADIHAQTVVRHLQEVAG